jgi:hypothetical protein
VGGGWWLAWLAGCGGAGTGRYVPASTTARATLETALQAWQAGGKPGLVAAGPPAIQVVDAKWEAGQKLAGYEILREEPGQGPRWFAVKLKLQTPPGEQVVKYAVLGNDPLWVYREEDFQKLSGM